MTFYSRQNAAPKAMPVANTKGRQAGWSIGIEDAGGLGMLLGQIEQGLDAAAEKHLRERLRLPLTEMAPLLGTSARTLGRRQEEGYLTSEESDRLYRYARLFERAVEVLGGEEGARTWMKSEQLRLGSRIPLEIARFEPGAREVEDLLGRIEHGLPA